VRVYLFGRISLRESLWILQMEPTFSASVTSLSIHDITKEIKLHTPNRKPAT